MSVRNGLFDIKEADGTFHIDCKVLEIVKVVLEAKLQDVWFFTWETYCSQILYSSAELKVDV